MKIDHIGYVVNNIELSINEFKKLGWSLNSLILDEFRHLKIAFMNRDSFVIELLQPTTNQSPISNYLSKNGNGPHHICYKISDINKKINELFHDGYIIVKHLEKAIAMGNKEVAFLYKVDLGLIELVTEGSFE